MSPDRTGRWCTVGRRVVAYVVAAVVTVALVAAGLLAARGGPDRSPAVLPALDLDAAGQATAGSDGAGAAIEPARPRAHRPGRASGTGAVAGPWPRGDLPAAGAPPEPPGGGAGLEAGGRGRRRPGRRPGRRSRPSRPTPGEANGWMLPGRPPRPGRPRAGRGALDLRRRARSPCRSDGRPLPPRRRHPVPRPRRLRLQLAGGPGQAVPAPRPAEPGRGRADRPPWPPRPGWTGGADVKVTRGLRHPHRHHRPGGGRPADLGSPGRSTSAPRASSSTPPAGWPPRPPTPTR